MLKDRNVPDDVMSCSDPYVTVDDIEASAKRELKKIEIFHIKMR